MERGRCSQSREVGRASPGARQTGVVIARGVVCDRMCVQGVAKRKERSLLFVFSKKSRTYAQVREQALSLALHLHCGGNHLCPLVYACDVLPFASQDPICTRSQRWPSVIPIRTYNQTSASPTPTVSSSTPPPWSPYPPTTSDGFLMALMQPTLVLEVIWV